jgi:hypothetical protein
MTNIKPNTHSSNKEPSRQGMHKNDSNASQKKKYHYDLSNDRNDHNT